MKLVFEHKGRAIVIQRHESAGVETHNAYGVTIRAFHPCFCLFPNLNFSYTEHRFRVLIEYELSEKDRRYCEVFALKGQRLFDSRDFIPFVPTPKPRTERFEHEGKRPHPRHFQELRSH
jgi:hypothetical protein